MFYVPTLSIFKVKPRFRLCVVELFLVSLMGFRRQSDAINRWTLDSCLIFSIINRVSAPTRRHKKVDFGLLSLNHD